MASIDRRAPAIIDVEAIMVVLRIQAKCARFIRRFYPIAENRHRFAHSLWHPPAPSEPLPLNLPLLIGLNRVQTSNYCYIENL